MARIVLRAGKAAVIIVLSLMILGTIAYSIKILVPAKTGELSSERVGQFELLEQAETNKDEEDNIVVEQIGKEIVRTSSESGELSKLFEHADTHKDEGGHIETGQIKEETIQQQSDTAEALGVQMELVLQYSDSYDRGAEDAAFEKFIEEYGEHEGVAKMVCELADHCVESDPQKALDYYEYAMDNWLETADTMWAQSGLVKVNLALRDLSRAEAAYEALLSQFSEHENLPEAVYEVASAYQELDPARGLEVLEYAMNRWPDYNKWTSVNDSIIPHKNLVVLRILVGDELGAQEAYETLLSGFSTHASIPEVIYEIADIYRVTDPQRALELYEHATNTWPDYDNWTNSGDAIFQQMNLVLMKIELGDKEGADAVCDNIINEFSEDNNVAMVINELADAYMVSGETEKALNLYQYAEQEGAESVRRIWSDVASLKSDIMLDNDQDKEKTGNLITDHLGDPEFGPAVFSVAQQYYREAFARENEGDTNKAKEYFQKAGALYRTIIEELPESTTSSIAIESRLLAGATCSRLEEPAKAIEYYEEVVTNWPESGNAWHAQFMVAKSYDDLMRNGTVSRSEADVQIRNAYEQLVSNYPDSPGAAIAAKWLDKSVK
jgi:tetratricopeptide (TPR) repeat protein